MHAIMHVRCLTVSDIFLWLSSFRNKDPMHFQMCVEIQDVDQETTNFREAIYFIL